MRSFPPREPPPERRPRRDVQRPEGPFERLLRRRPDRDPAPIIIGGTVAFLALVIVIVLSISLLSGGGGDGGDGSVSDGGGDVITFAQGITGRRVKTPALPPGLVALSSYFEFEAEEDVPITVQLPLSEAVDDPSGLGFYVFIENRWQRLAEADVQEIAGKVLAEGEFPTVPANLAVLRVLANQYQVAGSLPTGTGLHADARPSVISPRDYIPDSDGGITGEATEISADSILLLPTIVGSSQETAATVNEVLQDDTKRQAHIDAIVTLVQEAELDGIDLEYSSVKPDLASEFTEFVTRLADALHDQPTQKRLGLSLPPPSDQRQAYDWKKLGQSADIIKVLPLADPITYWEEMPGAIGQVVRDVDPVKVMLVINPFSIEDLGDVTRPIGYLQAMALAAEAVVRDPNPADVETSSTVTLVAKNLDEDEGASPLRWDDDAAAVSFASGGTDRRRVFIENSFSAAFKMEMVQAYRLGGLAISDASASSDVANLWPTVDEFVRANAVSLGRPNDQALLPVWQATDGGDVGAGAGTTATWIAPSTAGTFNLLLVVSDGELRFGRRLAVEVKRGNEPSSTPLVTFGPTPTTAPTGEPTETPTPSVLPIQVGKRADGDDADEVSSDPETASSGSAVKYRVVIDNDSDVEVTITSILDDLYPAAECLDIDGNSVIGVTLSAEDNDAEIVNDKGTDSAVCYFTETVSGASGDSITDKIVVTVEDVDGNVGSDFDTAKVIIQ
jgi:hypothetical protein